MILHKGVAIDDFVPPVGAVFTCVFPDEVQHGINSLLCGKGRDSLLAGIVRSEVLVLDVLLRIQHIRTFPRRLPGGISVIGDTHSFAVLSVFGRHDNDSVGAPRTIDGSHGGILMDSDGLDIVRIQIIDSVLRQPVHDIKRRGASGDGADSTDSCDTARTRSSAGGGDGKTCHLSLKDIIHARHRHSFQFLASDNSDCSGHILFGNGTISRKHNAFKLIRILLRNYFNALPGNCVHRCRPETYHTDSKHILTGCSRDAELSVNVSPHSGGRVSINHNYSACQWLTAFVHNLSANYSAAILSPDRSEDKYGE